jgi:hypothetical protein
MSAIQRCLDTITGKVVTKPAKVHAKTATDLKKDIEAALRAKVEREALEAIAEEAKAAHAAKE